MIGGWTTAEEANQGLSFVWGNISADQHNVTREMVEKAWEKIQ